MKIRRLLASLSMVVAAVTIFTGCESRFSVGTYRYYNDRIWFGDPYCRYSWDYGCDYDYNDAFRVRLIFGSRHHDRYYNDYYYGRRWHDMNASYDAAASFEAAKRPTSWQSEFGFSSGAVAKIRAAFDEGLAGKTARLAALGISNGDMRRLSDLQMPSNDSIARAAERLGVSKGDLRDFVELYLIRMRTALASSRR